MRIVLCIAGMAESAQLSRWLSQYCQLYGASASILTCSKAEQLFDMMRSEGADVVFMGLGGPEGFLTARRLRELDRDCRIIYVDDTQTYAVRGVRLHFTDFILRPVEFKHIVRAMKLAGVG